MKDAIIKTGITVIGLDLEEVLVLAEVSKMFHLDFDDAYQYAVAQKYGLQIMSFDADFDRTKKGRKIPELKSNGVRPPHPKGMGYASGRTHARLAGDQKSSSLLCPDSFDLQNCDSAFGFL